MSETSRVPAVVAYLPVVGWLVVYLFARKNPLAIFHLKQAIGWCLFLLGALIGWAVVAWILAWIPYMGAVGIALFTLVIAAYLFGAVAWVMGVIQALRKHASPLPVFGKRANRLPIR